MNSKERVLTAVAHSQPDRIPVDYWAVPELTETLLEKFGLVNEEQLLEKLKIDIRYVKPDY
ncbi:uroporphyrinogen-III decarboxylase, partial [Candidatus Aerophobetes bacterium]|nr:uroporphyrinogen-III decarboxylase [Candidatus Aerophobetes bacterium]